MVELPVRVTGLALEAGLDTGAPVHGDERRPLVPFSPLCRTRPHSDTPKIGGHRSERGRAGDIPLGRRAGTQDMAFAGEPEEPTGSFPSPDPTDGKLLTVTGQGVTSIDKPKVSLRSDPRLVADSSRHAPLQAQDQEGARRALHSGHNARRPRWQAPRRSQPLWLQVLLRTLES